ncbi:MAG: hypothetical protein ABIO86_00340 [Sphingomonas sp.]
MKIATLPAVLLALLACAAPSFAQSDAQSSPEDRQRLVSIAHSLERAPLDPGLQEDRSWAITWLTDAPDVTVNLCPDAIPGVLEKDYAHNPEILVQYMVAMGAFIIENPGKSNDPDAQQPAGVESTLNAYRVMRTAQPDDKSPALEKLLGLQSKGELLDFVHKAFLRCRAKSAK